jgi:two-component system sporulation sensor kinase B
LISLIKPLLVNITILFSFTFNANLFFPFQTKYPLSFKQKVYYGFLGALGGLVCMFYPIETLGETHFDFRMIAILIITIYGGWLSGSIILGCVTIFRYIIGGDFLYIGIAVCLAAFLTAIVFRKKFLKSSHRIVVGALVAICYFMIYFAIIYFTVPFLNIHFYFIYFISSFFTYVALIFVIEHLIQINKQFEEMVYLDKLTMIGQLTASIAHEIRNPLSTVRGFIQFISHETQDEQLKKFSPLILEELDRTNSIITNYLKVAKPEKFQLTTVPLHQVTSDCVQLMRPFASYSNVSIEIDNLKPIYVRGDEQHLKQAIMNILKNGIEACDGQGTIKLDLNEDSFKNAVILKFTDDGRGMTQEQLKHIGLPFYTTKTKGTGLGSMVTNKIIREMQGRIEYESEINKGTIVTIIFPMLKKDLNN